MEAISHWLAQNEALTKLGRRAWRVVEANWLLGFTAFGGPPVHFKVNSSCRLTNLFSTTVP
ncbi:hypothetical protein GGR58DRAFT_367910 [Xylaria digitata]|nr:hypothetical protein GGR58DRAFT_367910 [Xylaria digitata]